MSGCVAGCNPAEDWQTLSPAVALGADVGAELRGEEDPTGWTFAVYAGYSTSGPDTGLIGLTATAVGGDENVVMLVIPAAATAELVVGDPSRSRLYVEVWRVDSGNTYPVARLVVPYYDPIRETP